MSNISILRGNKGASIAARVAGAVRSFPLAESTLLIVGVVIFLSYALLACAHVNDRYQVSFVSAVYAALAQRLNAGTFYPELYDGVHYGGTRYMPLSFVPYAGIARLTGEYLIAGKLLTYGLTMTLCVQLFLILRRFGCTRGQAVCLASLVLVTPPGFLASLTIRGDLLPVVLQLAALMIVWNSGSPRAMMFAGLLCTLAFLGKLTAVWAGLAVCCSCLPAGRRRLGLVFAATWLGSLAGALGVCQLLSGGRMLENFSALAGAGIGLRALLRAPNAFLAVFGHGGLVMGLVVPVLVCGVYRAVAQRHWTLYHSAAVCSFLVLLVIFADMRTVYNHALDLVVLAVIVAGCLWAEWSEGAVSQAGSRVALALIVGWAAVAGWVSTMENRVREVADRSWTGASASYARVPLAGVLPENGAILSEDPWVEIARGRTPTLLDPDSFARLSQSHPHLTEPLLRRVRNGEFASIVLLNRLDSGPTEDYRWQDANLGWPLIRAIEARYHLAGQFDGFFVYVPNATAETR